MAQLTIEYLLYVQDYLMQSAAGHERQREALGKQIGDMQEALAKKDEELRLVRKEFKYARKIVHAYERLVGPLASKQTVADEPDAVFPNACVRRFVISA